MSSTGRSKILVYGGTGSQGAPIVSRLCSAGYSVRVVSRGAGGAALPPGAEPVQADLNSPDALVDASRGVDHVVLMLPLVFDPTVAARWTENAVRAAERAKVTSIVLNTSAPVPDAMTGIAAVDIKVAAEKLVSSAGIPFVVVRPTIYLGNLTAPWSAPGIMANKVLAYPLPADTRLAWISWEEVASAISATIGHPDLLGQRIAIGGAHAVTGPELAMAFQQALGGAFSYAAIPLPSFEAGLNAAFGSPVGTEIAKLYAWFGGEGKGYLSPLPTGRQLLGLSDATGITDWVGQQDWSSLASGK